MAASSQVGLINKATGQRTLPNSYKQIRDNNRVQLLSSQQIRSIVKAFEDAGISYDSDTRSTMLGGIPHSFLEQLDNKSNNIEQLLSDLNTLRSTGSLIDGSVPLITWLSNAEFVFNPKVQVRVFEQILAGLAVPAGESHEISKPIIVEEDYVKSIWRDALKGLLAIAFFLLLRLLLDLNIAGTQPGAWLAYRTSTLLQTPLMSSGRNEDVPVAVLDIRELREQTPLGQPLPRRNLRDIINALLAQERKPRAIAMYVDFSHKDVNSDPRTSDQEFFSFCKEKSQSSGVPIFLGVTNKTLAGPPEQWLEFPEFQELAVNISLPKSPAGVRQAHSWLDFETYRARSTSLSMALASQYPGGNRELPAALRWAVMWSNDKKETGFVHRDFLINYGPLEQLQDTYPPGNRLTAIYEDDIVSHEELFGDKLVIVGNAAEGQDLHAIPLQRQPVPGIYVHACAAYTLAKARLYQLTLPGRLVLDVLLSTLILGTIAGVSFGIYRFKRHLAQMGRVKQLIRWLVAFMALIAVAYLVRRTRLIWDDFIFIIIAVVLSTVLFRLFEKVWALTKELFLRYFQSSEADE